MNNKTIGIVLVFIGLVIFCISAGTCLHNETKEKHAKSNDFSEILGNDKSYILICNEVEEAMQNWHDVNASYFAMRGDSIAGYINPRMDKMRELHNLKYRVYRNAADKRDSITYFLAKAQ